MVAPRIAIENIEVKKLVLMAAPAESLHGIIYPQLVNRSLSYAEQIMDSDRDGRLSIREVVATKGKPNELLAPLQAIGLVEKNNTTGAYQWYSQISTNRTGNISIQNDLKPMLIKQF